MGEKPNERMSKEPWKPRIRKKRPYLGTLNWERHKAKLTAKRKAANRAARETRRAQHRAAM